MKHYWPEQMEKELIYRQLVLVEQGQQRHWTSSVEDCCRWTNSLFEAYEHERHCLLCIRRNGNIKIISSISNAEYLFSSTYLVHVQNELLVLTKEKQVRLPSTSWDD